MGIMEGIMDRNFHARGCKVHQGVSVFQLHHAVNQALRMNPHFDAVVVKSKQMMGLDHFQSLIDERGGINRDFWSHVPGGMPQSLCHCDTLKLLTGFPPKWSSRAGENNLFNLLTIHFLQTLKECRMFRINGNDLPFLLLCFFHDFLSGHDQTFLIGQCHILSGTQRGECRSHRLHTRNGHHHEIRLPPFDPLRQSLRFTLCQKNRGRTAFHFLMLQKAFVRIRTQSHHLKVIPLSSHNLQRLRPDGTR